MSKLPIEYLRHIYDECVFIIDSVGQGMTKDDLMADEILKRAITRSLEIIGEASKNIPSHIKQQWSQVPCRNIAGMRDRLIHDYIGVNYTIVWDVVKNKIPEIKPIIELIMNTEEKNSNPT